MSREAVRTVRIPMPPPEGEVRAYLLNGDLPTIVDVGWEGEEAAEALLRAVTDAGLTPEAIRQVILTHWHPDHVGQLGLFPRARRLISTTDALFLTNPAEAVAQELTIFRGFAAECGMPGDAVAERVRLAKQRGRTPPIGGLESLEPGSMVRAGSGFWEVLATPGHTPGHICFLERERRWLISGDHLMPDGVPFMDIRLKEGQYVSNVDQYLATLGALEQLEPGPLTVFPGHGDPFSGVRERVAAIRRRFAWRRKQVGEAVLDHGPMTAWEVTGFLYPSVTPVWGRFRRMKEMYGHLHGLAAEGLIRPVKGGATRWVSTARSF